MEQNQRFVNVKVSKTPYAKEKRNSNPSSSYIKPHTNWCGVLSLKHCAAAGDDPGCHCGNGECAGVHIAGATVDIGAKDTEYQYLRHKYDQNTHKGAAEGRTEQQVSTRADSHKEGNVFNQYNHQNTADHQQSAAPPAGQESLEAGLIGSFRTHTGEDLAVIEHEEQGEERYIHQKLTKPLRGEGLEEGPDKAEVQFEHTLAQRNQHIHQ